MGAWKRCLKNELEVGGELLFCAHHARANAEALEGIATRVVDETERLSAE